MPSLLKTDKSSITKYAITSAAEGIGNTKYKYMLESGYNTAKSNITPYNAPDAPTI